MERSDKLDRIRIRGLSTRCIVGLNDWEREKKQDVVLDISLYADLSAACRSDRVEQTVDYKDIRNRVLALVESSRFFLIERMAEAVADLCLEHPMVERVDVTVDKLGALRFARSVAVQISRARGDG